MFRRLILSFLFLLVLPITTLADQIHGRACYRFSDQESISAARQIALSLAKRNALEGYNVFVGSSSIVENITLKNDLITSITGGSLKNLRVTSQSEDLKKRKICRTISASVEPVEIKQQVAAQFRAYQRKVNPIDTGLPENNTLRILQVRKFVSRDGYRAYQGSRKYHNFECSKGCIYISAHCKKRTINYTGYSMPGVRITWINSNGIPEISFKDLEHCAEAGDTKRYVVPLPPGTAYTFSIDAVEWRKY